MAEGVGPAGREAVICTDPFDALVHAGATDGHHRATLVRDSLQARAERGDDGDVPAGRSVFCFPFFNSLIVLVRYGGSTDVDHAPGEIHVRPIQGKGLRLPEGGQRQQGGNLHAVPVDGVQKNLDLVRVQKLSLVGDHLGERHLHGLARGLMDHGGHKTPGIFQGLGPALAGLGVYHGLPPLGRNRANLGMHHTLESVALDDPIPPDRGRG